MLLPLTSISLFLSFDVSSIRLIFMWVFPISRHSFGRWIRRAQYWRLYSTCGLAPMNPSFSDYEQIVNNKGGNSKFNAMEFDNVRILQTLHNLRNNPNLALSFVIHVKELGGSLDIYAYASIVRMLSYWSLHRKLDSLLVELIGKDDIERGFRVMDLVGAVADGEQEGSMVLVRLSNAIVKAYATLQMFDEAISTLFHANRRRFVPNILSCNFLMNRLIKFGKNVMVVSIFRQLQRLGFDANDYTYATVIKALCREGHLEEASNLLEEMAEAYIPTSISTYTTYIEGLCLNQRTHVAYQLLTQLRDAKVHLGVSAYDMVIQGFCNEMNMEAAEYVLLDMEKQRVEPDGSVYSAVINGYCKNDDIVKALDVYSKMKRKGIKINCVTAASILQYYCQSGLWLETMNMFMEFRDNRVFLDRVCYNVALDALCKLGKVEDAVGLFQEMMRRRLAPDAINYTTLIGGYCLKGKIADAQNLVDRMKGKGSEPDVVTYCVLAKGLASSGRKREACGILDKMKAKGLEPNAVVHNMIIEGLCIAGKVEDAEVFLEGLKEKKCLENYASMIRGYCRAGLPEKAFELFVNVGTLLSKNICFRLFTSLCRDGHLIKAKAILERMLAFKVEPSKSMFGRLIGAFCRVNDVRKAEMVFDDMVARGMVPDLFTYTIMIKSYCKLNCLEKAYRLFDDMKQRGIKPDVKVYTVLLDGHKRDFRKGEKQTSNVLTAWREMNEIGLDRDVNCYTLLINQRCKKKNIEEAAKIFDQMMNEGLDPHFVSYAAQISSYLSRGYIDKAIALTSNVSDTHSLDIIKRGVLKFIGFQPRE